MVATITPDAAIGLDPLGYARTHLSDGAYAALTRLRTVLERDIAPLMGEAWDRAQMPRTVLDALVPLDLMQPTGVDQVEATSSMFSGFRNYLLARTDVSVATLYNAQSGLFRTSVRLGGSADQAARHQRSLHSCAYRPTATSARASTGRGQSIGFRSL